jgi:hypothetical protein
MADVLLTRDMLSTGHVPAICMRCGAPAAAIRQQRVAKRAPWILTLIFFIGPLALVFFEIVATRITIPAPMCLAHQHHWFKRRVFVIAMFVAYTWLLIGAAVLESSHARDQWMRRMDSALIYTATGLLILWVATLIVCERWTIGPNDIGPRGVTLRNVHPAFRDAIENRREVEHDLPPTHAT